MLHPGTLGTRADSVCMRHPVVPMAALALALAFTTQLEGSK
jgi:hypothetical protein